MDDNNKYSKQEENLQEVAERFKDGDIEAYNILFHKYQSNIYRYCVKILGNIELAKDAYQETFIKMFEHRAEFRSDNFSAWLFTISRNVCFNLMRNNHHSESFDELIHSNPISYKGDIALSDQINKALSMMPIQLREVLILREYNDLSYQEIATILKIELSTVKIRIHRARNLLRKILIPLQKELYES